MTAARWVFGLAGFALLLTSVVRVRVDGLTVLAVIFLAVWLLLLGVTRREFWYRG